MNSLAGAVLKHAIKKNKNKIEKPILNFKKDGLLDGIQEVYYDNGRIYTAITYKNGIVDGVVQCRPGRLNTGITCGEGIGRDFTECICRVTFTLCNVIGDIEQYG